MFKRRKQNRAIRRCVKLGKVWVTEVEIFDAIMQARAERPRPSGLLQGLNTALVIRHG